eukprot:2409769-Pleurochrysis_carterae.AAC.1
MSRHARVKFGRLVSRTQSLSRTAGSAHAATSNQNPNFGNFVQQISVKARLACKDPLAGIHNTNDLQCCIWPFKCAKCRRCMAVMIAMLTVHCSSQNLGLQSDLAKRYSGSQTISTCMLQSFEAVTYTVLMLIAAIRLGCVILQSSTASTVLNSPLAAAVGAKPKAKLAYTGACLRLVITSFQTQHGIPETGTSAYTCDMTCAAPATDSSIPIIFKI